MNKKQFLFLTALLTFSTAYCGLLDQMLALVNLGAGQEPTDVFDQIQFIEEGHRQDVIATYQASRRPPCFNSSATEIFKGSCWLVATAISTGWITYHHGVGDFDHPLYEGLYVAPAATGAYGLKLIGNGLSNAPATKLARSALKAWAPFASSAIKLEQLQGKITNEQAGLLEDAVDDIEKGIHEEDIEMDAIRSSEHSE